jgi:hypothetical protein
MKIRTRLDGKVFDSDTARCVGIIGEEFAPKNTLFSFEAGVYKTRRSRGEPRYFLYGKGRALSIFGLLGSKKQVLQLTEKDEEGENLYPISAYTAYLILRFCVGIEETFKEFGEQEGYTDLFSDDEKLYCLTGERRGSMRW